MLECCVQCPYRLHVRFWCCMMLQCCVHFSFIYRAVCSSSWHCRRVKLVLLRAFARGMEEFSVYLTSVPLGSSSVLSSCRSKNTKGLALWHYNPGKYRGNLHDQSTRWMRVFRRRCGVSLSKVLSL